MISVVSSKTVKPEGIERNSKVEEIPQDLGLCISGTLWRYTLRWLLARARIRMKSHLT